MDDYEYLVAWQNAPILIEKIAVPEDKPKVKAYYKELGANAFPVRITILKSVSAHVAYDNGDIIFIPGTSRGDLRIPRKDVIGMDE